MASSIDLKHLCDALVPAMLAAGACLLRHREAGIRPDLKADGSPVTVADREAEDIITAALMRVAPDVPVIGEEAISAGHVPVIGDRAFLVDALDGTREFIRGGEDFTVNIGLVVEGNPVFGLLLAPASGRLFGTRGTDEAVEARVMPSRLGDGSAARPDWHSIRTAEPDRSALRVLCSRSHRTAETDAFLSQFQVAQEIGIGSSVKFGLIAAGEADIYPRFGPTSAWDIAAGHAVLKAAGGTVTTPDGRLLRYLQRAGDFLNPHFVAWAREGLVKVGGGAGDQTNV